MGEPLLSAFMGESSYVKMFSIGSFFSFLYKIKNCLRGGAKKVCVARSAILFLKSFSAGSQLCNFLSEKIFFNTPSGDHSK